MHKRLIGHTAVRLTLSVAVMAMASMAALETGPAVAQTGGGGGGAGGSGGGTGSSATGGGATGAPSATTPGTGTSPGTRTPSAGPQVQSPALRPSPVPRRETGVPPVPSVDNAEPNSPVRRQDPLSARRDGVEDQANPSLRSPDDQTDPPLGSSGGTARSRGTAGGDPLMPTDPSGSPAEADQARRTNSIGEEPERVTRGGGAAGKDLDECMALWDPSTHMTREQWKTTCERLGR
mgnify:CR=1 FL=1